MSAAIELSSQIGVEAACLALGVNRATYYIGFWTNCNKLILSTHQIF